MLNELLNIVGEDFSIQGRLPVKEDAAKALWVVKQLFPKNKMFPAGSVEILGQGKDIDIVMRGAPEDVEKAKEYGFKPSTEKVYKEAPFTSLVYNKINLIIVHKAKDFSRFKLAVEVCIALRQSRLHTDKNIRVIIHEVLRNAR